MQVGELATQEVGEEALESNQSTNNNNSRKMPPSWQGEKLFPPKRSFKNASKAWQYGGFRKKPNGGLETDKTVCGLCGHEQKFRNSPTNLAQHLQNLHPGQVDLSQSSGSSCSKTLSIKHYLKKPSTISKYANSHPKQVEFRKMVVKWVIANKRPLSIVDDEKLGKCFGLADPKLKMPSRMNITRDIRKLFAKEKVKTIEELSKVEAMSCTKDGGSSSGAKSFVDVNVHYVTEDFQPKKKILDVFEMKDSKTAENYRARVEEVHRQFGVENKVISYTTDNEPTMRKAFREDERTGCFAHIESKSCKNILNKQKHFNSVRKKMQKIAKKANNSSTFKYALQREQKNRGLRELTLKQEVKTRFTAFWIMTRSFLNDPNEKKDADLDEEKVEANIQAINAAMKEAKFKKKQLDSLELKSEDLSRMKQLVKVLFVFSYEKLIQFIAGGGHL